ncbi:MAG: ribose-phosphate pyrophosphokinase [Bradymonadaceae bacterium]
MTPLVFSLPDNEVFADRLAGGIGGERGEVVLRRFPDGESYVRVEAEVEGRPTVVTCTLDRPDGKVLPLFFLAETLRDLGAAEVGLVAPYLAYMRQDRRFEPGEGVTARYFGPMVSRHVDWLATVDPHLHRLDSLDDVYDVPTAAVGAAPVIAGWVERHVDRPLIVGPDEESEQWVADVAADAGAPHVVLEKERRGDREVDVSVPDVEQFRDRVPILVDDIVSTGQTMIETVGHLVEADLPAPVCAAVHGVFADEADAKLAGAGARGVVTTDTIPHPTNEMTVVPRVAQAVGRLHG